MSYEEHRIAMLAGDGLHPHYYGMIASMAACGANDTAIHNAVWPWVEEAIIRTGRDDIDMEKRAEDFENCIVDVRYKENPPVPAIEKPKAVRRRPLPDLWLPDPLLLQHEQFTAQVPDPVIPELLFPFEMAFAGFTLQSSVLTPMKGRAPNLQQMPLGKSTAGKDAHSTDILKSLLDHIRSSNPVQAVFIENCFDVPGTITSDTALMQELHMENRAQGMMWLSTEGVYIIERIAKGGNNASVKSLASLIVKSYDGYLLGGTTKASKKERLGSIQYPNLPIIWYGQPETFFEHLTPEMLASGFAGRGDYAMFNGDIPIVSIFGSTSGSKQFQPPAWDDEYVEYIKFAITHCANPERSIRCAVSGDLRLLGDFEEGLKRKNDNLEKFIVRIPMSAEKRLTIYAGHQHLWECFKSGDEPFQKAPDITQEMIEGIMPWMEHQLHVREDLVYGRIGENIHKKRRVALKEIMVNAQSNPKIMKSKNKNYGSESAQQHAKEGWILRGYINAMLRQRSALNLEAATAQCSFIDGMVNNKDLAKLEKSGSVFLRWGMAQ